MDVSSIPAPRARRRQGVVPVQGRGRAAIYVRVSTLEQAEGGENGGSLESQEARCRDFCRARGLEVAAVYVDAGASGGTLEREALTAVREVVRAGDVATVVVYAVDRLSRRQADTLRLLEEFEQAGAGLASASQPFDTTTAMGRAMLGMLAVFAELQRAEIRERTAQALRAKRARGEATGRAPFGLCRDGKLWARHPVEWPVVALILERRAAGWSCQAIAEALNASGVATPTGFRGERRGLVAGPGRWSAATVSRLCGNPAVLAMAQAA